MSRPLRIEYKDAYYHVMNRGAGRRDIFDHDEHRSMFLELLRECVESYQAQVHAYCLMDNHYHLLISTPKANLNRIMRHLNGVYTQRYNRLEKTDGSLFRGRYKAIVVDADAYLLSVSRYIHLNPVSADRVKKAHEYPWSSYRAYIGHDPSPRWLCTEKTLSMIGSRSQQPRYQQFVEGGLDPEILKFYENKKQLPILGSTRFINKMKRRFRPDKEIAEQKRVQLPVSLTRLVALAAKEFQLDKTRILQTSRGRGHSNIARAAVMFLGRKVAGYPLNELADYFGLKSYGSVSGQIHRFKQVLEKDESVKKSVDRLHKMIKEQT